MNAKILSSIAVICMMLFAVGVGSQAYFVDTEEIGTNSFTAAQLDLELSPSASLPFVLADLLPGDSGSDYKTLTNTAGSVDGELDISITNYVEDENGCIEPEVEAGDPGGAGDLHLALRIAMFVDVNQDGTYNSGDIELCYDGSQQNYPGNAGGNLHYSDPSNFAGRTYDDIITMSGGTSVDLVVVYNFLNDSYAKADAIFMTDKIEFDITASLEQVGTP
jgi:predicted ribosomally synthesized peptide with SipW-like signal peptide